MLIVLCFVLFFLFSVALRDFQIVLFVFDVSEKLKECLERFLYVRCMFSEIGH